MSTQEEIKTEETQEEVTPEVFYQTSIFVNDSKLYNELQAKIKQLVESTGIAVEELANRKISLLDFLASSINTYHAMEKFELYSTDSQPTPPELAKKLEELEASLKIPGLPQIALDSIQSGIEEVKKDIAKVIGKPTDNMPLLSEIFGRYALVGHSPLKSVSGTRSQTGSMAVLNPLTSEEILGKVWTQKTGDKALTFIPSTRLSDKKAKELGVEKSTQTWLLADTQEVLWKKDDNNHRITESVKLAEKPNFRAIEVEQKEWSPSAWATFLKETLTEKKLESAGHPFGMGASYMDKLPF